MTSPLHLYIHIPYCIHKCHYCDFNSHETAPRWDAYGEALLAELRHWAGQPQFKGREVTTIFIGGGTPSLAPPELIARLIDEARRRFALAPDAEITMEANPGTVDAAHFHEFRQAGVNRLSIGVQSFHDDELKWLERIHSAADAERACRVARDAGFANINLDLMFGLHGQSLERWLDNLDRAIALEPEHLSCYQLTVEPHTKLAVEHARHPYALPDEDTALKLLWETRLRLAGAGYAAYEVSNFARPGFHCRHNDGYWLYHDYVGIGAGASGKWDCPGDAEEGGAVRYSNLRSPNTYIEKAFEGGAAIQSQEALGHDLAAAEAVWMGLRRSDGLNLEWFNGRFGAGALDLFADQLKPWFDSGSLVVEDVELKLTREGLPFADSIAEELF